MDIVFWMGIAAAGCITLANVPQAWKIIRTGDVSGVSGWTYALLVTGNALWLIYGLLRDDMPLTIANSISTLLCALILVMKLFPNALRRTQKTVRT